MRGQERQGSGWSLLPEGPWPDAGGEKRLPREAGGGPALVLPSGHGEGKEPPRTVRRTLR